MGRSLLSVRGKLIIRVCKKIPGAFLFGDYLFMMAFNICGSSVLELAVFRPSSS